MKKTLVGFVLSVSLSLSIAQDFSQVDSLKRAYSQATADSTKYKIQRALFLVYLNNDSETALVHADNSLRLALLWGDSMAIVRSYHARGDMRMEIGEIMEGISDMEVALKIAERNQYKVRIKYLLNNLAIAYTRAAIFDKALDYNFRSLRIREEEGDKAAITISYNNIGVVYLELNDFENALFYFNKSYLSAIELNELIDIEVKLINIGFCYNALEKYDEAINSFLKAFEFCNEKCSPLMLTSLHSALGIGYLRSGKLGLAEKQFEKSLELSRLVGSSRHESIALRSLGEIEFNTGHSTIALQYLDSAQNIALGTDFKVQILDNYSLYSTIYNQIGNFQLASNYQQLYINLSKEVFSSDLIQKISRITTDYEEHENIKTIAAKDQILNLQTDIIARQKSEYAFIITITFLVMGLALVMYRANQSQRKTNQQLAKAKETIQHQNELLSNTNQLLESEVQERTKELFQTNESLTKVNEEMDNFIYKTSHDIRGPLATLKGMCNVAMVDVKDELALTYLKKLDTSAAKLNAILSRLLIINQINHSLLNPEYIKFEDQIEEIIALEVKKGFPARMKFTYDVEPGLNFRSDKEMTRIILENLIDNAIKFYNDSQRIDPFVYVRVFSEGQHVVVKVTDNGIGIDESSKDKIFNLFVRASERSDSGGIGLYLSKLASTKLGGTIELTPTSDSTTQFTVTFPRDLLGVLEERRAEELKREKQRQNAIKKG